MTMNIYTFAQRMELEGKGWYENLSATADFIGLKNIFTMLAADEQKHYDTITAMIDRGTTEEMSDSFSLETAKSVFIGLEDKAARAKMMKKDLDGYRLAMKIEVESVRLYEDAAAKEQHDSTRALLLKIAGEEKMHYTIMENICDFVEKPEYFLAWREFSNLQEF